MSDPSALWSATASRLLRLSAHLTATAAAPPPHAATNTHSAHARHHALHESFTVFADAGSAGAAGAASAAAAAAYGSGGQGRSAAQIRVPRGIEDIEANKALEMGEELDADHPGFKDMVYRQRRKDIVGLARTHRMGTPIPRVDYSPAEIATWGVVLRTLRKLFPTHACETYNRSFAHFDFREDAIPQLADVSRVLEARTGWRLRPVPGLLTARDFLNGLAFKVFHSTQYIRHQSRPLYTPEPDVCHDVIGHVPMLADPDFSQLSQEIGIASLGVSDEDLDKLATVYWFSVEFGVLKENGQLRAYGAGLLSSFGELENALSGKPEYREFDPNTMYATPYPITTYQPVLFVADSFLDATNKLKQFASTLKRVV